MPVPNALRRVLLAGVATLLLAAASPAAYAAGVLKIAHEQDVTTFDPILTIQNADIWVMDNMNAGLVRVTHDGTGLEPRPIPSSGATGSNSPTAARSPPRM